VQLIIDVYANRLKRLTARIFCIPVRQRHILPNNFGEFARCLDWRGFPDSDYAFGDCTSVFFLAVFEQNPREFALGIIIDYAVRTD
jgi:hypothetical protein